MSVGWVCSAVSLEQSQAHNGEPGLGFASSSEQGEALLTARPCLQAPPGLSPSIRLRPVVVCSGAGAHGHKCFWKLLGLWGNHVGSMGMQDCPHCPVPLHFSQSLD